MPPTVFLEILFPPAYENNQEKGHENMKDSYPAMLNVSSSVIDGFKPPFLSMKKNSISIVSDYCVEERRSRNTSCSNR